MKIDGKTGRDILTNMYGRRVFFERAKAMIEEKAAGYYILSSINVENLKFINSAYGLDSGDAVLRHIADCTVRCMAAIGGIAGRINGDAFAALFPASYADSKLLAELYLESAAPACIDEKIRLRVGRFVVNVPGASIESMYDYAKIAGDSVRGNYEKHIEYYNDFMKDELLRKHQIIYEMDSALAEGQFEPWLQPQYNHATGAMIGAEVLVRWNRNGTYISPAEFIPNVNDIDEFQKELKEGLLAKGIHSLILAPMWKDGRLIGFVGTDNPTRAVTHLVHLSALGDYLAVLLTRRDFPEQ